MKILGIKKRIDSLGRFVIPSEYRKAFGFNGKVELIPCEEGILVRKVREDSSQFKESVAESNAK